jgi:hypothetical protein
VWSDPPSRVRTRRGCGCVGLSTLPRSRARCGWGVIHPPVFARAEGVDVWGYLPSHVRAQRVCVGVIHPPVFVRAER